MHRISATACEATLYRKSGAHYLRVGWCERLGHSWRNQNRAAIHYKELDPTAYHPMSIVYFHLERAIRKLSCGDRITSRVPKQPGG